MRLSLRHLLLVVAGLAAGACQNNTVSNGTGTLPPPQKLSYELDPSGDPTQPAGIRLAWDDEQSSDLASYRVYSRGSTSGSFLLRGETTSNTFHDNGVPHQFLAAQLPNGVTRCFDVSAEDTLGYESLWALPTPGWTDTPRPDARNVLVWGLGGTHDAQSGFRFWDDLNGNGYGDAGELGLVQSGTRSDIDFVIHVNAADSSLWIVPVFTGTSAQLYSANPIADLTSIDLAPSSGYSRDSLLARPGFGYVFELVDGSVLRYGALRMTHVSRQYVIFDWSVPTKPGYTDLAPPKRPATSGHAVAAR